MCIAAQIIIAIGVAIGIIVGSIVWGTLVVVSSKDFKESWDRSIESNKILSDYERKCIIETIVNREDLSVDDRIKFAQVFYE